MLSKIIMPPGGQTTDELTIVKWYVKTGEKVNAGDLLFEIETDKATMPVESYADGIVLAINYSEGDKVKTGNIVAWIGEKNDKIPEENTSASYEEGLSLTSEKIGKPAIQRSVRHDAPGKVYASPLAKSIARTENLKIEDVASFCSKKLLKKEDVNNYLLKRKNTGLGSFDSVIPTIMRKTIARRMKQSFSTAPHYFVSVDVDMTETVRLRKKLNALIPENESRITYNDILMKVIARAAGAYPLVNSSYSDDEIRIHKNVSIGLAVSLETGLIVPVVRDVNKKSLTQIASTNALNILAAKTGRLKEQDITGGTISLSNLGMFGINGFTAIINQPESCILAAGAIIEKPVVRDHQVAIREVMNITASFDHRIIDGAIGAAFLAKIKNILEEPELLFLPVENYLTAI